MATTKKISKVKKPVKTPKLFYGQMPGLCGYGISVIGFDKDEVRRVMVKNFSDMKKAWSFGHEDWAKSFDRAMEYFGGTIEGVEPNKAYSDGLRE